MADSVGSHPGTVSRFAWIGGLLAGVLVAAIGIGTLSWFEVHKITKVVVEMVSVGLGLLVTTRIWQRSARTGTTDGNED